MGNGHLQAPGANGSFTFGRVLEVLNELHFIKSVEVVTEVGETNKTNLTVSVKVDVPPGVNVTVHVKVEIAGGGPLPPECKCKPWCGIVGATINGVQTVVAAGGKIGECDEAAQVTITGPGTAVNLPGGGRRTFAPAANGNWTVTATVCGATKQCFILLP